MFFVLFVFLSTPIVEGTALVQNCPVSCHCEKPTDSSLLVDCDPPNNGNSSPTPSAVLDSLSNESFNGLKLRGVKWKELNVSLFTERFPDLTSLSLASPSNVEHVIISPCAAKNLMELDVSSIGVSTLSVEETDTENTDCEQASLQTLKLAHNRLGTIPSKIRSFANLSTIKLAGNRLVCNPDLFWLLHWYQESGDVFEAGDELACGDEKFRGKPVFLSLRYLEEAELACPSAAPFNCSCEVKRIVPLSPTGSELMPLVTVNCSARNLTRFPPSLPEFAWELRMEGNHLSSLDFVDDLSGFDHLVNLYLDDNRISAIKDLELTQFADNFRLLSLSGNNFQQLPTHDLRAILRRNVNVHSIRLGKNPWRCDCEVTPDLQSFLAEFQHLIQDHSDIRCAELHNDAKSLKRISRLPVEEMCEPGLKIHYLDILNTIMGLTIICILTKLVYDWYMYRRYSKIPWLVQMMP